MWLEQWRALAARIDGLIEAGNFLLEALKVHASDVNQTFKKSLLPELRRSPTKFPNSEKPMKRNCQLRRLMHSRDMSYTTGTGR